MSQLDPLIDVLLKRHSGVLTLCGGQPIGLTVDGVTRPVSSEPLEPTQVVSLIREIAPPELIEKIDANADLTFAYTADAGAVEVEVRPLDGTPVATVRPKAQPGRKSASAAPRPSTAARRPRPSEPTTPRGEVDRLLNLLLSSGGSDLHLRVAEPPILRRDGQLVRLDGPPLERDQLKAMLEAVMPVRDQARYAETGDADFAYELEGVSRFRGNAALDRHGPMGVFRVVPSKIPSCEELEISKQVQALCSLTKGLVVVTGPTGAGKSTTLAALVDLMNRTRQDHILTIEDPLEFVHEGKNCLITHRQVGLHTRSFKSGLRAALREDPDVILIGELRDLETTEIAIETAETGHLVFGTLHTTTAASTIDRIIDQFPVDRQAQIRVMLSESLRGVIAQTLCRSLQGGRVAAREILITTTAVSNLIREGKTFQIPSIIQTNRKLGMITLNDSLIELVEQKRINVEEAFLRSVDKTTLAAALKAREREPEAAE